MQAKNINNFINDYQTQEVSSTSLSNCNRRSLSEQSLLLASQHRGMVPVHKPIQAIKRPVYSIQQIWCSRAYDAKPVIFSLFLCAVFSATPWTKTESSEQITILPASYQPELAFRIHSNQSIRNNSEHRQFLLYYPWSQLHIFTCLKGQL